MLGFSGMALNHSMASDVLFHWLTFVALITFLFILQGRSQDFSRGVRTSGVIHRFTATGLFRMGRGSRLKVGDTGRGAQKNNHRAQGFEQKVGSGCRA